MKPATFAPAYCALYPELAELARSHGYALAVHGSLSRDFDLIAVPWGEKPSDPYFLVKAIEERFTIRMIGGPEVKAHGRIAYSLSIGFGHCAVDLSFTPIAETAILGSPS